MKPLIGITSSAAFNRDHPYEPVSQSQIDEYVVAIREAGGLAVIIPIAPNGEETEAIFDRLDGILFAGGNDIAPYHYGEANRHCYDIDEQRDKHELALLRLALDAHKPVLAICRGMQLINVVRGGTLYQDIEKETSSDHNHIGYLDETHSPSYLTHTLDVVPDTNIAKVLGVTNIKANSRHHQAVKEVGKGLTVNLRADDGMIEGVEDMSEGFVLGVQPHPESLIASAEPGWRPIFEAFIAATQP